MDEVEVAIGNEMVGCCTTSAKREPSLAGVHTVLVVDIGVTSWIVCRIEWPLVISEASAPFIPGEEKHQFAEEPPVGICGAASTKGLFGSEIDSSSGSSQPRSQKAKVSIFLSTASEAPVAR